MRKNQKYPTLQISRLVACFNLLKDNFFQELDVDYMYVSTYYSHTDICYIVISYMYM